MVDKLLSEDFSLEPKDDFRMDTALVPRYLLAKTGKFTNSTKYHTNTYTLIIKIPGASRVVLQTPSSVSHKVR